jgi:hypothetical protein
MQLCIKHPSWVHAVSIHPCAEKQARKHCAAVAEQAMNRSVWGSNSAAAGCTACDAVQHSTSTQGPVTGLQSSARVLFACSVLSCTKHTGTPAGPLYSKLGLLGYRYPRQKGTLVMHVGMASPTTLASSAMAGMHQSNHKHTLTLCSCCCLAMLL